MELTSRRKAGFQGSPLRYPPLTGGCTAPIRASVRSLLPLLLKLRGVSSGIPGTGFNILSFPRGPWETLAESQALCPAPGSGIGSFLAPCGLQVAQGRLHRPATVTLSAVSPLPLWEGRCSGGPPPPPPRGSQHQGGCHCSSIYPSLSGRFPPRPLPYPCP